MGAAGAAGSVGLAVSAGACFAVAGLSGSLAGASAGRGRGSGTEAGSDDRRSFGLARPNRLPQGPCDQVSGLAAAAAGSACAQSNNSAAIAVTVAIPARPAPPQGHLRRASHALNLTQFLWE